MLQLGGHTELGVEASDGDLELHGADGGENGGLVAAPVGAQDLDDALGVELLDAATEALERGDVGGAQDGEVFRGERRQRGKATAGPSCRVSPMPSAVALTSPITSPGYASSMVSRLAPNICCAYLVAKGRPVPAWVTVMPRLNRPEQTRTKATWSRWALFMFAWILNTNPAKGASTPRGVPPVSTRGCGAGAWLASTSRSCRTPKLATAAPNSTGVVVAAMKVS
ncbi:hypothetical protein GCM10027605_02700 [Micromonospora zhanjiangensis]